MRRFLIILFTASLTLIAQAQELYVKVQINSDQIEGSNKQVFQTLQSSISEFMNNTRWTNQTVAPEEKVECNMSIIVTSVSDNKYNCELTLQSRRPVYKTNYDTPLLNMRDKNFTFTYQEFDRLEYTNGVFTSNLSSMLAYYAYLILGYDADSYTKLAGTPYFQQCENIASTAQGSSMENDEMMGWKAFDSRTNRYAIANNLMDEAFKGFREYLYTYHRLGLDQMATNVENGRARISKDLGVIRETYRNRPSAGAITLFVDAKYDELINLFKKGTTEEKTSFIKIMSDVDPTRSDKYEAITNPQ